MPPILIQSESYTPTAGAFFLSPRAAHTLCVVYYERVCHFPLSDWQISERRRHTHSPLLPLPAAADAAAFLIARRRGNLSNAERNLHARKFNDFTSLSHSLHQSASVMFSIRRVQHRETSSEESISAPLTLSAWYCDRVEFQKTLLPRFPLQLADLIIIQQPAHKLDCVACRSFLAMQIHA
jgi:hypothetical protein